MNLNYSSKLNKLEIQNAGAIRKLAEGERKKKREETREARNNEALARQ